MNCGIDGLESHCEQSTAHEVLLCLCVARLSLRASSLCACGWPWEKHRHRQLPIPTNVEAEEGNIVIVAGVFSFFFGQGKKQLRRQTYVGFSGKA